MYFGRLESSRRGFAGEVSEFLKSFDSGSRLHSLELKICYSGSTIPPFSTVEKLLNEFQRLKLTGPITVSNWPEAEGDTVSEERKAKVVEALRLWPDIDLL